MKQLSDYKVTFHRTPMFGAWYWTVEAPDGETLHGPIFGLMLKKENAERDAARRIRIHGKRRRSMAKRSSIGLPRRLSGPASRYARSAQSRPPSTSGRFALSVGRGDGADRPVKPL